MVKIKDCSNAIFLGLIFVVLLLFFYNIHPLLPFDGDDWVNIGNMRPIALPKWGDFNPSKVFPETAFPIMGLFGAYILAPLMGDYLLGVTMASALFMAGMVVVYIGMFNRLLQKVFALQAYQTIPVSIVFLLLHFLILKTGDADNNFLLFALDTTCYYHYIAPDLLNASFVMYFMTKILGHASSKEQKELQSDNRIFRHSLYIFALYMAIFSNVLCSIILIAFVIAYLGCEIKRMQFVVKTVCKDNRDYLWMIAVWLISLIFETSGGRAGQVSVRLTDMPIGEMLAAFGQFFVTYQKGVLIGVAILLVFILGAAYLYRQTKNEDAHQLPTKTFGKVTSYSLIAMVVWLIYVALVSAKAGSAYLTRADVMFGFFFYLFLLGISAAAFCLAIRPKLYYAVPIVLLMMFSRTMNQDGLQQSLSAPGNITVAQAMAVDRDIIQQCIEADRAGTEVPELHVPKWCEDGQGDNWPHPYYRYATYMQTLYYHGLVERYYENVKMIPDRAMNEKYNVGVKH